VLHLRLIVTRDDFWTLSVTEIGVRLSVAQAGRVLVPGFGQYVLDLPRRVVCAVPERLSEPL
jgi:hypothetical protein